MKIACQYKNLTGKRSRKAKATTPSLFNRILTQGEAKMTTTIKIHIKITCKYCNGSAYIPIGQEKDYKGEFYTRYQPCSYCEGSGLASRWISLKEFINLIDKVDTFESDYLVLAEKEPVSQYQDSRESAGI